MSGQLSDHVDVIKQLANEHAWMDGSRVGATGASGGGLASTRAILTFPDTFSVAVSFCGNHDNAGYNAGWGETYHGPMEPLADGDTYTSQANQHLASNLVGKLFLIHGEMDENVHHSLSMKVAAELVKANRDFDYLVIPNTDHSGVRGPCKLGSLCPRRMARLPGTE